VCVCVCARARHTLTRVRPPNVQVCVRAIVAAEVNEREPSPVDIDSNVEPIECSWQVLRWWKWLVGSWLAVGWWLVVVVGGWLAVGGWWFVVVGLRLVGG
jgi:hypothetical protein